jgi:hypothetical protein
MTRIRTKTPEAITLAKVSLQFFTAYCIMMIINTVFVVVIIIYII